MNNIEKNKWIIFTITVMGNFIAFLDSTTVNIALYHMAEDFSLTLNQVQNVYTVYMLVLTSFLPLFGKLGDVFEKNKLYSFGFVLFGIGAFLSFTANNFYMLILYRCIEALGGSILLSNSIGIISSVFKGEKRGKALGMIGAILSVAGMSGPAIAGVLMDAFSWHAIFLISLPICIFAIFLSYKFIPTTIKKVKFKFDFLGFILFIIFMFSFLLVLSKVQDWGWFAQKSIILYVISFIGCVLFYIREKSIDYPMINFSMFNIKEILWGNIALTLCYMAMFTNGVIFPYIAQKILLFSATKTALLILPFSISVLIIAPYSGTTSGKFGSKYLTLAGGIFMAIGISMFFSLQLRPSLIFVVLGQLLQGAGSAMFQAPTNMAIMDATPAKNYGISSSLVAFSRNSGMIMGVATATTAFAVCKNYAVNFMDPDIVVSSLVAYKVVVILGVVLALLSGIISFYAFTNKRDKTY